MVTDSAGNSAGLGGRLFTIYNPCNQVPVKLLHFSIE